MGKARNLLILLGLLTATAVGTLLNTSPYKTRDFSKDTDKTLLARMIFGEARNCSHEEKVAIAYTALNRNTDGEEWNGEDNLHEVLLMPKQYSCFNDNDPNRKKVMNPERYDRRAFRECLQVADEVMHNMYPTLNKGQNHYHTRKTNPKWRKSLSQVDFGNTKHLFYRNKAQ